MICNSEYNWEAEREKNNVWSPCGNSAVEWEDSQKCCFYFGSELYSQSNFQVLIFFSPLWFSCSWNCFLFQNCTVFHRKQQSFRVKKHVSIHYKTFNTVFCLWWTRCLKHAQFPHMGTTWAYLVSTKNNFKFFSLLPFHEKNHPFYMFKKMLSHFIPQGLLIFILGDFPKNWS